MGKRLLYLYVFKAMAVHIISTQSIHEYIKTDPKNGPALLAWVSMIQKETWNSPLDIVQSLGVKTVDILGKKDTKPETVPPNRVVINVKGNHIRVIAKYQFHSKLRVTRLYIKWIGLHAEYTKLCAKNLQYEVDQFK
jgi:mRNA interferase HigB